MTSCSPAPPALGDVRVGAAGSNRSRAAQGVRLGPVGEEARRPPAQEAAGPPMEEKRRIHASAVSVMVWPRRP